MTDKKKDKLELRTKIEEEMRNELAKGYQNYIEENYYENVNLPKIEFELSKEQKYKQALEEIKEMLEFQIEQINIYPLKTNLGKILQKCEVLEIDE